jgi:hypothetical protein
LISRPVAGRPLAGGKQAEPPIDVIDKAVTFGGGLFHSLHAFP